VEVEPWGGGYRTVFEDVASDTTAYMAWETAHRLTPAAIVEDSPSDWASPSHGADYLVVAHADLMAAATVLDNAWASFDPSLRVEVADVEDVYDEFNYGVFHPRAVRDLLDYAYHEWQGGAPGHVLLLGDASWDYKLLADDSDPTHRNFVPSWGNPVCDDVLAAIDGDDLLPDYAMGRIAVENADTAVVVAEKLAEYLGSAYADTGQWRNNVLLVADYHSAHLFETQSEQLADSFIVPPPARFNPIEVYKQNDTYYPPGFDSPEGDTVEMYINSPGVAAANYIGHGATWTWGTILWDSDIEDDLHNGSRMPFVTSMTCHTGRFANPYIDSFGEIWMWKEGGGAVAFFGSTGWGSSYWDRLQIGYLYRRLFLDQNRVLGDVCLASKVAFADSEGYSSTFLNTLNSPLNFHLLGDPCMKLALAPRPDLAVDSADVALLPPVPVEGDTVLVTVQVYNTGPDPSPEATARFAYRQNTLWIPVGGDVSVPPIPAGGIQSVEASWQTAGITGPCSLRVAADPEDQLFEGWETNNVAATTVTVLERQPDLAVFASDLFWEPEEPDPTQSPVTLGALVRNLGTNQAENVEVLVGLGDSLGMVTETGTDTVAVLAPGDSAAVQVPWEIGMGDVGPHWLWVEADPAGQIEELDEGNNVASTPFTVLSPPDLAIGANDILFSNDSPPVGDSIAVAAVVRNLGQAVVDEVPVWFFEQHPDSQGSVPFGIDTVAVPGEAQDTASASWATNGNAGWNTIYVSVDPLDEVEESDEDNNNASRDILVLEASDLLIQSLTVTPAGPVEGDTASVSLRIRNAGEVPADSFLAVIAVKGIDGMLEHELLRVRQDLAGETSDTLAAAWTTTGQAGQHWLAAYLDADGVVAEANESNNADSVSVTILTAPDLEVDAWADAETVAVGETVSVAARIMNLGEGEAANVRADLMLGETLLADSLIGAVAGGSEVEARLTWSNAPVGTHTLLFRAGLDGWEPDTLNNLDEVTVTVRPLELPDLVVAATPSDTSLLHGDTLEVACAVTNTGEQPALAVQLGLVVGAIETIGPSWSEVQPGQQLEHTFRVVPVPGDHVCRVSATSSSAESDTTNNAVEFRVSVTSRPDLIPALISFEPAEAVKGDTISVAVGVWNDGDTDVGYFAVAFFVGDPLLVPVRGVVEVLGGIAAGDSIVVSWPWDTLPDSGTVSVTAWLDPNNGVVEESETNNRLAGGASVLPDEEPPTVLFTRGLGGMVVSGELLSPRESFEVVVDENASGIDTILFKLSLDGDRLVWGEDFVLTAPEGFRHGGTISLGLATGIHQVTLDSVFDGCGNATEGTPLSVEVELSGGLKVRDVMPFPNPSQGATRLSALCSDPTASGWFVIHSLGGTTVARVEATGGGPSLLGEWDGCDEDGSPVANGVYLVRLVARSGDEKATSRGRIVIWR
jgi:subtilase family serine protease